LINIIYLNFLIKIYLINNNNCNDIILNMNNVISLRDFSGIEIFLSTDTNEILFGEGLKVVKPDIRKVSDANDYYVDTTTSNSDKPLYYMYRGVSLTEDITKLAKANLRYDITLLQPGIIGNEYIKTIGHVHPISALSIQKNTFTEVYSVLYGSAIYILQKFSCSSLSNPGAPSSQEIEDLILIEASAGDCIYIPSHYGHVTVNIGSEPLIMANVLYSHFQSIYEPYKRLKGAAAYILKDGDKPYKIIKNENYHYSFDYKLSDAKNLDNFSLNYDKPLYLKLIEDINSFDFLYL
jgi:glucose-6-phosphate isomerase, archaeal